MATGTTPPVATGTSPPVETGTVPVQDTAYWLDDSTGAVYSFGGAPNFGSMAGRHLDEPIVGMAAMPTGKGYWEVASDGGIFAFGSARYYGSEGGKELAFPIVAMAAAPTGHGYWLAASDGRVFAFGAARYYGSEGKKLVAPIAGIAPTRTGHGYWLVAADGGVFTFGNARFHGSLGGHVLRDPITGIAATPTGAGYWLVATDGAVYTFGAAAAHYYGSLADQRGTQRIVGIATLYDGKGYWLTGDGGEVTAFGTAVYWGSTREHIRGTIAGIATGVGDGDPGPPSFQTGSYGYDVSQYQCKGRLPSSPHQIGVVEIAGWSYGALNPCLAEEVAWAAGGLNLYTLVSYGTSAVPEPGCIGNAAVPVSIACNYGYGAAIAAYQEARVVIGTRVDVPWWVDVEQIGFSKKSPSTAASRSVVVGAYDALRYTEDINTVGFYFSLSDWNNIVGDYNPSGPLFPAWWTGPTPALECVDARSFALSQHNTLPSGPIQLLQYTDRANRQPFDGDYAC